MKEKIIFISKDALRCDALSCYGSTQFVQPNIDALAAKGTVYKQYYTAGGSTAMAFTAMATGQYLFASGRKLYDGTEGFIDRLLRSAYEEDSYRTRTLQTCL